MPNSKSAIKRMRSDERKYVRNQRWLSELKTLSKKLAGAKNEPEKVREFSVRLVTKLDKAVNKGVIPRGRADRKKSRIAKLLSSLENKSSKKASKKKSAEKKEA